MGTWGTAITSDDTVADVMGMVTEHLKRGASMAEASELVRRSFESELDDPDDGPLFWLGLAAVQWRHGAVDPAVLAHVRAVVRDQLGLDRWRDDANALAKRMGVLARFAEQIALPNPRPRPLPKYVIREAPFDAGDCLALRLDDGRYVAALVLAADNSNPEYGTNLMATLDYLSARVPQRADFERRNWLYKSHGNWQGQQDVLWCSADRFKREKPRVQIVCRLPLAANDVRACDSHGGWSHLGQQVVLNRRHLGVADDQ